MVIRLWTKKNKNMLTIYTPKITNRILYTFDFIFCQYFGLDYNIETNIEKFKNQVKNEIIFCINYSNEKISDVIISVPQEKLLLEENIQSQKIFISKIGEMPVLFPSDGLQQNFGFDIFSAVFYLISRYEEYLPHEQDKHGRYCSSNSILNNSVFNFKPIIEIWLQHFQKNLLEKNKKLQIEKHQFTKIFTFDIDNAFQYKHRNWLKNPPNIFNQEVRNVLLNKKQDSYNTFDFIFQFCKKTEPKPYFFFLLNDSGKRNSIVNPDAISLYQIIKKAEQFNIGIHFSYHFSERTLKQEKEKLAKIVNNNIIYSRQHFLKINFPDYFRIVAEQNIQIDFSLGYPDVSGCRAGTTLPFYFFDLIKNKKTSLLIQPFVFMDATYQYYQNKENIQQKLENILKQIKGINGNFVGLFHNDLLQEELEYKEFMEFIRQY